MRGLPAKPFDPSIGDHLPEQQRKPLAVVWEDVVSGRFRIAGSSCSDERCYLMLCPDDPMRVERRWFASCHVRLVERVLLGESQKALAMELSLSPAAVTVRLQKCMRALGLNCRPQAAPLLLVLAAHASRHNAPFEDVRFASRPYHGMEYRIVSCRRPDGVLPDLLGEEQRSVIRMLLEGRTYREIAVLRNRSVRTVSNQLTRTYVRLGVTGRVGLLRQLVQSRLASGGR
jgi:DNA-binding NarL/FixJ family response regulator